MGEVIIIIIVSSSAKVELVSLFRPETRSNFEDYK
jgi:hypothetical protein